MFDKNALIAEPCGIPLVLFSLIIKLFFRILFLKSLLEHNLFRFLLFLLMDNPKIS